ncbi:Beta-1,4-endoglucanase [Meloidogyne graminicola]|uniref:Beta-1,4-endoglucanase n=1 Tax=Meloidogyne graminicola TaxID=189291 RepID=A0A8S9ZSM5_9BILA|nr:Beta-1,4-endoglucanase [Meloidogyne graminicola]
MFSNLNNLFNYLFILILLNNFCYSFLPFGKLYVQNGKLMGNRGRLAQLRGMSLFHSQLIEGSIFYNEETIYALKCNWHVNIVRACLGIMNYGNGGYLKNKNVEKEKIKTVVNAAIKHNIYVIINFHYTGDELFILEAYEFFKEMSYEYKGKYNVIYEIHNEVINLPWQNLVKYHETIIKIIRSNDQNAIIICTTPFYDQHINDVIKYPIKNQNNIMYSIHFYSGEFSVQKLRENIFMALEKNIPLFVTEYGLSTGNGNGQINKEETEKWWKIVSYINWAISNKKESSAALLPGSNSKSLWFNSALTESGRFVKQMLYYKQPIPYGCPKWEKNIIIKEIISKIFSSTNHLLAMFGHPYQYSYSYRTRAINCE